jgi:multifunctional cyclase/dehydratase/O-methyltransferase
MLAGKWTAAAIAAAAELGIADVLGDRSLSAAALAEAVQCDAAGLERLLAVLSGEGVLEVDANAHYSLTALGKELRSDALRDLARYMGSPFTWAPFAHLADALRSGRSAFEVAHGEPMFRYLDQRPEVAARYHRGVDAFTRREARALSEQFDFTHARHVVDVGGGLGTLLVEVLSRFSHLKGTLVDRPAVIAQAEQALADTSVRERIELVASDFFEQVPTGADVYVLKHVLHNWDDERAITLLQNCARGLAPDGKLLIVEGFLLPEGMRDATRLMDLEMFVLCGAGRERRKPEFRGLLHRAGLRLESSQSLAGTTCLTVASRR